MMVGLLQAALESLNDSLACSGCLADCLDSLEHAIQLIANNNAKIVNIDFLIGIKKLHRQRPMQFLINLNYFKITPLASKASSCFGEVMAAISSLLLPASFAYSCKSAILVSSTFAMPSIIAVLPAASLGIKKA